MALLDGVRVAAPDRPGYDGTSARDFAGNAAALVAFARGSGVDQLVVVGHSWAGGVALQLALDNPELVAGLCLIGSIGSPLAVTSADRLWAQPGVRHLAGLAVCCAAALTPGRFVRATGSRLGRTERRAVRRSGLRWLRQGAASSFAAEQAHLVRDTAGLYERLPHIHSPAIVLAGAHDRTVTPRAAADLVDRLPCSRLVTVPGGHLLPLEDPASVAQVIQECVSEAHWR